MKVKELVLQVKDQELKIGLDEAKELYEELQKLFESQQQTIIYPIWTGEFRWYQTQKYWCSSSGQTQITFSEDPT